MKRRAVQCCLFIVLSPSLQGRMGVVIGRETIRGQGTGKQIVFRAVSVFTMGNGQIVYERRIYDFTGFLMKLGVITARPSG